MLPFIRMGTVTFPHKALKYDDRQRAISPSHTHAQVREDQTVAPDPSLTAYMDTCRCC